MFAYFENNYPWNMAVLMAFALGGQISEIDEACRPLKEKSAGTGSAEESAQVIWWRSWSAIADRLRGLGDIDLAAGHGLSAGAKYRRACVYYLIAERLLSHRDQRKHDAYDAMVEMFEKSAKLLKETVRFVSIPYEGVELPALFVPAASPTPSACMIVFDGFDAPKEFNYLNDFTNALLRRNVASLHVDHPGVGAALRKLGLPAIKEMERPATAAVDWLTAHPEIDSARIGIIAPSLGGYYAPRAAAFEQRLACCVAWGARWDNDGSHGRILRNPDAARSLSDWLDHAMWYYGTDSKEATARAIAAMTLEGGVAEMIRCPILVTHGGSDRQVPIEQAHITIERTINSPRRDLKIFTDNEGGVAHCGVDNMTIQIDYMADWIADVFGETAHRSAP
jgi:dienelactone hydrolase